MNFYSNMPHKKNIEDEILNIIEQNNVHGQIELQKLLQERGFDVPQATLSRYLKKLHVAKIANKYEVIQRQKTKALQHILAIKVSELGLIIVHTLPGHASSIAFLIDQKYVYGHSESQALILGTIAGDDTILLIPKRKSDIQKITDLIESDFL